MCVVVYKYVIHGSDGVSTWANFDGRTLLPSVILLCPEVSSNYNVVSFVVVYTIVYKHLNTWVHIGPSKSMCLWAKFDHHIN